jgi:MFS family permease
VLKPRKPSRTFFGWRILAGAVAIQALIAALFLQAYGVYAAFWMAEFGWSRTAISLAYSLHRTESGLLGPFHGWLLQRVPPRRIVLVGIVVLGGGFFVLSTVHSFLPFVVVFLLMAVGASLAGILSLTTVIVNWFERRRARALALLTLGLSLGGLAIPLVGYTMVAFGWRPVAVASGVLVLAVGIPVSRLLHRDPETLGLRPDGDEPVPAPHGGTGPSAPIRDRFGMTAAQAMRTWTFWAMSFAHATAMSIVAAVSVHFVIFARDSAGLEVTTAASFLTLITLVAIVGQLLGGVLGDRYPKRHIAGAGMLGHAAAMLILAFAGSAAAIAAAAVLHGLGWGVRGPLMGAMRADYFGRASFSMVMGTSSLIVMLGSVGGPLLAGVLADASGSYRTAFVALAVVASLGALLFHLLPPPPGPASPSET